MRRTAAIASVRAYEYRRRRTGSPRRLRRAHAHNRLHHDNRLLSGEYNFFFFFFSFFSFPIPVFLDSAARRGFFFYHYRLTAVFVAETVILAVVRSYSHAHTRTHTRTHARTHTHARTRTNERRHNGSAQPPRTRLAQPPPKVRPAPDNIPKPIVPLSTAG